MSKKDENPKPVNAFVIIDGARPRTRRLQPYDPDDSKTIETNEPLQEDVQTQPQENELLPEIQEDNHSVHNETQNRRQRRKREIPSYTDAFVRRNEIKRRQCVYISYEVHQKYAALVRVLVESGQEISLGGYIDTVLYEHLQTYKDDINELYRKRTPDLL